MNSKFTQTDMSISIPPQRLATSYPINNIEKIDYETGFDIDHIRIEQGGSLLLCSVCLGFPRFPVTTSCGHLFCEYCIKHYFATYKNSEFRDSQAGNYAPCPVCKHLFYLAGSISFKHFQPLLKQIFTSVTVKCPEGCDKNGSFIVVDRHQLFECNLRSVVCPNIGCDVVQPLYMLEGYHLDQCHFYGEYCTTCILPVLRSEAQNHNCKTRLIQAVSCYHQMMPVMDRNVQRWTMTQMQESSVASLLIHAMGMLNIFY